MPLMGHGMFSLPDGVLVHLGNPRLQRLQPIGETLRMWLRVLCNEPGGPRGPRPRGYPIFP